MQIYSIADIAGDNGVHAIGAATQQARALFLTAVGGTARFGDLANVGAARGVELPDGVEVAIRSSEADKFDFIQLGEAAAYVPSGTTLTITFGI
jgi:hypothetical protein